MTGGHIVTHVLSKDYTMNYRRGEIILLFGSNYTEGRGGGGGRDYQIWSQFTTFQIRPETHCGQVGGPGCLFSWSNF